jgi:hypothetical protein
VALKDRFDLAGLDADALDLELPVQAPEKVDLAVLVSAGPIPRAIPRPAFGAGRKSGGGRFGRASRGAASM